MTTVLGYFGCSRTVILSAPDAIRHNRPVHTAKTFEFLSDLFGPQEWKAAFRADWFILTDRILRLFILGIAAGTDQLG